MMVSIIDADILDRSLNSRSCPSFPRQHGQHGRVAADCSSAGGTRWELEHKNLYDRTGELLSGAAALASPYRSTERIYSEQFCHNFKVDG